MKLGAEDRKKAILAAVLGVVGLGCAIYLYNAFSGPSVPASPAAVGVMSTPAAPETATAVPPVVAGGAARRVATTAGQMDPTLHMEAMAVTETMEYTGTGRNIFSADSAPAALPKVLAPARPVLPIAPTAPVGPPPPPSIDLRFFGTETSASGTRQVFLLHGEDVYVASSGEIVGRRYKVVFIGPNSVAVEDMQNNNRQTLPLEVQ